VRRPPSLSGFHVEQAELTAELALRGNHRFSDYALIFRLDESDANRTCLHAETRATFPGLKGGTYRTMVIGTRAPDVLVTHRILNTVKRRARWRELMDSAPAVDDDFERDVQASRETIGPPDTAWPS
jgi:hypothetical protein